MKITPETLTARGYREVYPSVFARMQTSGTTMRGVAVVFRPDGLFFAGAQYDVEKARRVLQAIVKAFASAALLDPRRGPALLSSVGPAPTGTAAAPGQRPTRAAAQAFGEAQRRKAKAEKLLGALFMKGLESAPADVGASATNELDELVDDLVGAVSATRDARREKRAERRAAFRRLAETRREKFRKGLNKLAKKVAGSKVLMKLREGYAKILRGPIGKGAAKLVGTVLQAFGVPKKVTETAIMAHHERVASRMSEGGWAGTLARATEHRGAWRDELKHEGQRHAKAVATAAKQAGQGVFAKTSGVGEVPFAASLLVEGHKPAFLGIGPRGVYHLGAMG